MEVINILRYASGTHGTFGSLFFNGASQPFSHTIEPPWRDNRPNRSCIPAGEYVAVWHRSPRYGWVYRVADVPERSNVLFHWGNYGGDHSKGFRTHTKGCILQGSRLGWLENQSVVLASRVTVRRFFNRCDQQRFIRIVIKNA